MQIVYYTKFFAIDNYYFYTLNLNFRAIVHIITIVTFIVLYSMMLIFCNINKTISIRFQIATKYIK